MQETICVNDITMSCLRFGSGEKTFVLLPGLSVEKATKQAKAVERAYAPIAGTHSVYLFDRRDPMPEGYTIHAMAEDTVTVMQELGIEKACVCGISQGGMIAMDMAIHHPAAVTSLLLCSTCEYLNAPLQETLALWASIAGSGNSRALNVAFVEKLFSETFVKKTGTMLASVMPKYSEEALKSFLIAIDSFRGYNLRAELQKITCPAYVIGAAQDRVVGSDAAERLAGLLGCEYYVYPEYGHGVYDEVPGFARKLAEILEYLEK